MTINGFISLVAIATGSTTDSPSGNSIVDSQLGFATLTGPTVTDSGLGFATVTGLLVTDNSDGTATMAP